jgi:hypothetical protein
MVPHDSFELEPFGEARETREEWRGKNLNGKLYFISINKKKILVPLTNNNSLPA